MEGGRCCGALGRIKREIALFRSCVDLFTPLSCILRLNACLSGTFSSLVIFPFRYVQVLYADVFVRVEGSHGWTQKKGKNLLHIFLEL